MKCRSCGIEIADKALICYRCGTATTEAKFKPATSGRGGAFAVAERISRLLIVVLVAIVAWEAFTWSRPVDVWHIVAGIVGVVAGLFAGAGPLIRRLRRR